MVYHDEMGNAYNTCGDKTEYSRYNLISNTVLNNIIDKGSSDFIAKEDIKKENKEYEEQMSIYWKMVYASILNKETYIMLKLSNKGVALKDIAKYFNVNYDVVKQRMKRARKLIRDISEKINEKSITDMEITDIYYEITEEEE